MTTTLPAMTACWAGARFFEDGVPWAAGRGDACAMTACTEAAGMASAASWSARWLAARRSVRCCRLKARWSSFCRPLMAASWARMISLAFRMACL